jgi:diguanylate cyclase (GGDEF)-like protein
MKRSRTAAETPDGARLYASDVDDAPAPRMRLRPVHRMLLTIITGLLCGALLAGTAIALTSGPDRDINELVEHTVFVENALTETHAALGKASSDFLLAFTTNDPVQRNALIAAAAPNNERLTNAYRIYTAATQNLPGERVLRKRYDAANKIQTDAGLALLSASPTDPVAIADATAKLSVINGDRLGALEEIRAIYSEHEAALLNNAGNGLDGMVTKLLIVLGLLGALWAPIIFVTMRGANIEERMLRAALLQRQESTRRAELDSQIQRALEMARTEDEAYGVVTGAMRLALPPAELGEFLVADSSRAHFRQVSGSGPDGEGPGCPVGGPADCPATNTGQTLTFPSSARIDSCPWLRDRAKGACSAVCVPVAIAGRTIGVLHVTGEPDAPPAEATVQDLELVARKAGERIGMQRAFARSETEARTDPLTGLLNRRSLENRVRRLTEQGVPYVIAYADLDHFKALNTAYGHETGDRALRIFSRTLRDSIRPDDIPARWGGEEFVTLLPDCRIDDARIIAERVRERLAEVVEKGDVPRFTVSIGLAASHDGAPFSDTVAAADIALLQAKADGRDVVVLAAERSEPVDPSSPVRAFPARDVGIATAL